MVLTLCPRGMEVTTSQYESTALARAIKMTRNWGILMIAATIISSGPHSTRAPRSLKARTGIDQVQWKGVTSPTPRTRDRGPGPDRRKRQDAGDDRQVGDDRSRGDAGRYLPRWSNRRRGLDVSGPPERVELPVIAPAGRGEVQDRIGESERGEPAEVSEFVEQHPDRESDGAASHRDPPPSVSPPPVSHVSSAQRVSGEEDGPQPQHPQGATDDCGADERGDDGAHPPAAGKSPIIRCQSDDVTLLY